MLSFRLQSDDGRSEILQHLSDQVTMIQLRNLICKALILPVSAASSLTLAVHASMERRIAMRKQQHYIQSEDKLSAPIQLSGVEPHISLKEINLENMSTIVVQNCASISSRQIYFAAKKIQSLCARGKREDFQAMKLLRNIVARIVLSPKNDEYRCLKAEITEKVLQRVQCLGLMKTMGFIRLNHTFILPSKANLDVLKSLMPVLFHDGVDEEEYKKFVLEKEVNEEMKNINIKAEKEKEIALKSSQLKRMFEKQNHDRKMKKNISVSYSSYVMLIIVLVIIVAALVNSWKLSNRESKKRNMIQNQELLHKQQQQQQQETMSKSDDVTMTHINTDNVDDNDRNGIVPPLIEPEHWL